MTGGRSGPSQGPRCDEASAMCKMSDQGKPSVERPRLWMKHPDSSVNHLYTIVAGGKRPCRTRGAFPGSPYWDAPRPPPGHVPRVPGVRWDSVQNAVAAAIRGQPGPWGGARLFAPLGPSAGLLGHIWQRCMSGKGDQTLVRPVGVNCPDLPGRSPPRKETDISDNRRICHLQHL